MRLLTIRTEGKKEKTVNVKKTMSFLTAEIENSVETLVENIASRLRETTELCAVITTMLTVAVTVMRSLKMTEEVRLLGILVASRLAEKGVAVPENIAKLFSTDDAPILFPLVDLKLTKATHVVPANAPAPVPETAPARKIEIPVQRSAGESQSLLIRILKGFLNGNRIDKAKTVKLANQVLRSKAAFTDEDWNVFFSAATKAEQNGFFIFTSDAHPQESFLRAPADSLVDYIFGQDGVMISTLAALSEVGDGAMMPSWIVAKTFVLVQCVDALDQGDGLSDHEVAQVRKLLVAVEKVNGPELLIEQIQTLLSGDGSREDEVDPATETIGNGAARIIGDLLSVVRSNGHDAEETARLETSSAIAAKAAKNFTAAVSVN